MTTPAPAANSPLVCNPYSFVGRITDSRHVAFDDKRAATLRAYNAEAKLLASEKTFYRDDSRNNYFLQIPMVDAPAEGSFAMTGDLLSVMAEDDAGRVWAGVIDPAKVGEPGGVHEVDIVLAEDADGDGIDDELYAELLSEWTESDAAGEGGDFDPRADHDGDGMSSLAESLLGTDPFNGDDVLKIDSIAADEDAVVLEFELPGGHTYAIEEATDLTASNAWRTAEFVPEDGSLPRTLMVMPASSERTPCTIYLFPAAPATAAFYRLSVTDIP